MSRSGILVVSMPAIGDFVRCLTAVRIIAARHPGVPIDILGSPPATAVGPFSPDIRHVYEFARRSGKLDLGRRLAVAREVGKARHATAYVLATNFKAALVPFLAGIPERIGWFGEFRYPVINRPRFGLDRNDPPLVLEQATMLLRQRDVDLASLPPPRLSVPEAERAACREREGVGGGERVLALVPGRVGDRRSLALPKLIEIVRHVRSRGLHVWLIGAGDDRPAVEAIGAAVEGVRDMTHSPLSESILRVASADLYAGTDTGLTHVAAAFGGPVVAIYEERHRHHAGPLNRNVRFLVDDTTDWRTALAPGSFTAAVTAEAVIAQIDQILLELDQR
ncbi:lipopolysaccharide heptosyltransferase II [Kaistia algarum]|uniref:lipopolysaccharide heptosyltransferase II n=1 Tax=Kaistia algarum TaxID=2083279 RepID=UPI000CE86FA6|nr:lipopolysaccharide heptosyltransferase II [Kaistia algarum]MCX5513543.1 lipopolysaccharide heptosyltransferase II [Kaistia algarum]PPE78167.1 lipopolysaccharide heptosyltransferase II [Kaistia algarum]